MTEIAGRFAQSLDAEDYETAVRLLCEACAYTCRGEVYRGPGVIIDSYRSAGDSAKHEFNQVQYESSVTALSDQVAQILFADHLSHNGMQFTFQCRQIVEIDDAGLISRIEHVDLPGQRDALLAFRQRIGNSPPQ